MRFFLLAVLSCFAAACSSRESAPPAAAFGSEKLPAPAPAVPPVAKWTLDPENSSAQFVCKHLLANVRGMIPKPAGTVLLDEAAPANSKIEATLEVDGINTGVEERDAHLKTADFFDAARFPRITFVSTSVSRAGPSAYSVTGNLSMHGVTRPVTLAVAVSPPFNHAGGIRRGIEATGVIDRRDFGIIWEFPGEAAGVVIGERIPITIDAELVLQL